MDKFIHLSENRIFHRLYYKGKAYVCPSLVSYVLSNRLGNVRVGITTGKKVGNAVKRNRAKRLIRESFRQIYDKIKPGTDIVFVARTKTPFVNSNYLKSDMISLLRKAGVYIEKENEKNN